MADETDAKQQPVSEDMNRFVAEDSPVKFGVDGSLIVAGKPAGEYTNRKPAMFSLPVTSTDEPAVTNETQPSFLRRRLSKTRAKKVPNLVVGDANSAEAFQRALRTDDVVSQHATHSHVADGTAPLFTVAQTDPVTPFDEVTNIPLEEIPGPPTGEVPVIPGPPAYVAAPAEPIPTTSNVSMFVDNGGFADVDELRSFFEGEDAHAQGIEYSDEAAQQVPAYVPSRGDNPTETALDGLSFLVEDIQEKVAIILEMQKKLLEDSFHDELAHAIQDGNINSDALRNLKTYVSVKLAYAARHELMMDRRVNPDTFEDVLRTTIREANEAIDAAREEYIAGVDAYDKKFIAQVNARDNEEGTYVSTFLEGSTSPYVEALQSVLADIRDTRWDDYVTISSQVRSDLALAQFGELEDVIPTTVDLHTISAAYPLRFRENASLSLKAAGSALKSKWIAHRAGASSSLSEIYAQKKNDLVYSRHEKVFADYLEHEADMKAADEKAGVEVSDLGANNFDDIIAHQFGPDAFADVVPSDLDDMSPEDVVAALEAATHEASTHDVDLEDAPTVGSNSPDVAEPTKPSRARGNLVVIGASAVVGAGALVVGGVAAVNALGHDQPQASASAPATTTTVATYSNVPTSTVPITVTTTAPATTTTMPAPTQTVPAPVEQVSPPQATLASTPVVAPTSRTNGKLTAKQKQEIKTRKANEKKFYGTLAYLQGIDKGIKDGTIKVSAAPNATVQTPVVPDAVVFVPGPPAQPTPATPVSEPATVTPEPAPPAQVPATPPVTVPTEEATPVPSANVTPEGVTPLQAPVQSANVPVVAAGPIVKQSRILGNIYIG